ncbi:MAG: DUF72 domain-containing protein [Elusimicrobia bacterium]|nr:DUF72 domain-containing protein [Elusimicrobiota bacterium]
MVKIGCSGWPVGRSEYFRRLSAVEISSSFYNLPLVATASRWKEEAPEGFDFCLKAWQLVTHTPSASSYERLTGKMSDRRLSQCGHFKGTEEVLSAWQRTLAVARALGAKCVLFQTPRSFYPQADHLRDMYRFFKAVPRGKMLHAWEPQGPGWTTAAVRKVVGDLGLVLAGDPSQRNAEDPQRPGALSYWRIRGKGAGASDYSDDDLRKLGDGLGRRSGYVIFGNRAMWDDARRFQSFFERARVL